MWRALQRIRLSGDVCLTTATRERKSAMDDLTTRACNWIAGRDIGISSKTIWAVMMGVESGSGPLGSDVPHDSDDFGRCYRLLQLIPEWRARLSEVAARHPQWRGVVANWDTLTQLYEEDRHEEIYRILSEARKGGP